MPVGGMDFPVGINNDETARVENAFYIGETMVTQALWDTVARWAEQKDYSSYYPMMEKYLSNVELSGTGFRLPTPDEWELATRWRGTDSTNSVLDTINGVNFTERQ